MDYKLKCEIIKLLEKNFEKIFKNGIEFLRVLRLDTKHTKLKRKN